MNLLDLARSAFLDLPTEDTRAAQPNFPARRWQVRFPSVDPVEVIFAPEATRADVAAIYPGASIEPLPEPTRQAATPFEADELRALVALIFADADDADRAEVLRVALADPEAALTSFRLLQAEGAHHG